MGKEGRVRREGERKRRRVYNVMGSKGKRGEEAKRRKVMEETIRWERRVGQEGRRRRRRRGKVCEVKGKGKKTG